jgi:hypothetical protein
LHLWKVQELPESGDANARYDQPKASLTSHFATQLFVFTLLRIACTLAITYRIMGYFQRRLDRAVHADDLETEFFQLPPWQVTDHGGHDRLAILESFGNTIELRVPEWVFQIESAILVDLDLIHLDRVPLAVFEDTEFIGMTEVLIDLGSGF